MERSIGSQIVDTLHLILRILLGIVMAISAVASFILFVFGLLLGFWLSSKYGSPFEDPVTWVLMTSAIGAIPSLVAGVIVVFNNRLVSRDPLETLLAVINVTSNMLLYKLVMDGKDTVTAVLFALALIYTASAITIIVLRRKRSVPAPTVGVAEKKNATKESDFDQQ